MRRVLFLSTAIQGGGAEEQVRLLTLELQRRGWSTGILSLLPAGEAAGQLSDSGVAVFSLNVHPGRPDPRAFVRLLAILRRFRPNILHSHLFHANLVGRAARMFWPAPVVISTVHSYAETGRDSRNIRWRDLAYRLTGWLADATTFVSGAAAQRHVAAGAVRPSKVRIVANGVDLARFRPSAEAPVRDTLVWLAAGRMIWKKDYPTLLKAFAAFGEGKLLIAGDGPDEADVRGLAARLAVNAQFLGRVEDMPRLMNSADALVLSSTVEGLPMVLIEAAASGLPAIATDVGSVREIVIEGETGFVVPPGDPDALAKAMRRFAEMTPAARARMGRNAREHAMAHFGLRAVVSEWERTYRELWESAP